MGCDCCVERKVKINVWMRCGTKNNAGQTKDITILSNSDLSNYLMIAHSASETNCPSRKTWIWMDQNLCNVFNTLISM